MSNKEISELLQLASLMLSMDSRPTARFEVRAYDKAAFTISTLQEDVGDIYEKKGVEGLMGLPGIGKGIAGNIVEYLKTGKLKKLEEFSKRYPIDFKGLMSIEGIGARKAIVLYDKLGVKNLKDLERAVKEHRIKDLEGFGEKSEELIKKGIEMGSQSKGRMLLGDALPVAERMRDQLIKSGLADDVIIAGSARRMRETVGDLDILVLSDRPKEVMDFFVKMPEIEEVIVKGPTKTSVLLSIGINCDLRAIAPESFGAALQYFTGSKDHGVQVRKIAVAKGYSLNEYALTTKAGKIIPTKNEEEVYGRLGMQYVPPEMREARGEVQLAQRHKIPKIVELSDIRGDMHTHTKETDGANSIEEMVDEAMKIGLDYIATTNHTKSLVIARGMDEKKFAEYFKKVDALNEKLGKRFRVIKGAEVDILKDGKLDLEKKTLESMECVIASVHTNLKMEKEAMTRRIVDALDTGLVKSTRPSDREGHAKEVTLRDRLRQRFRGCGEERSCA